MNKIPIGLGLSVINTRSLVQFAVLIIFIEALLALTRFSALPGTTDLRILSIASILKASTYLNPEVAHSLFITLCHAVSISFVSVLCGSVIAMLTGWSILARFLLKAPVDFFRGIPASLLLVIGVISFAQSSDTLLILSASIPCTAICIFIMYEGISSIGSMRMSIFDINHRPKNKFILFNAFILPSLAPSFFQAIKLIVPYSLVLAVALEMMQIGKEKSAGRLLFQFQTDGAGIDIATLIIILSLGFISFAASKILDRFDLFVSERSFK